MPTIKSEEAAEVYKYLNTVTVDINSVIEADHRDAVLNSGHGLSVCCFDEHRATYHQIPVKRTKIMCMQILHNKLLQQK